MEYKKRIPNKEAILDCLKKQDSDIIGLVTTKFRYERIAGYYVCKAVLVFKEYCLQIRLFVNADAVRTNNYSKGSCVYESLDNEFYEYESFEPDRDYLSEVLALKEK